MANSSGNGLEQIQNLDNLKACGFSDEQARGILKAMSQNVATKSDVEITKLELKRDIEKVRADLSIEIEKVRKEISETKAELKRDIKEVENKIEQVRADLVVKIEETKSYLFYRILLLFIANIGILGAIMTLIKFLK